MTSHMDHQSEINKPSSDIAILNDGHYEALLKRLLEDEVITIHTKKEWNGLYDYMERNDIDPDQFRCHRGDIWVA